jgi:hypothetical protein
MKGLKGCFIILVGVLFLSLIPALGQDSGGTPELNVNFSIHDIYLTVHTLRSKGSDVVAKYKEDVEAFQKYMEDISKEHYDQLMAIDFADIKPDSLTVPPLKNLRPFIIQATQSTLFQKIMSQTQEFGLACREQWNKNYPATSATIKTLTGFKLNKSFTVYITHPGIKNSVTVGNNTILWSGHEEWANQATTSLWHEIMRSFMPRDNASEAVIEIMCDNHLRVQLNGGDYPPFVNGDPALKDLRDKIISDWKMYLNSDKKNILGFLVQLRQKHGL